MKHLMKKLSPARLIALGFASAILLGSVLLILPCSVNKGVTLKYIDSLYIAASAVCVTGLSTVDVGTAFTPLGQFFLVTLIQIGGLGVASVGAGIIIVMGKKVNIRERNLVREASNLGTGKGIVRFIKSAFITTLVFELTGAAVSFIVFRKDYPFLKALGISLFHSISAFNNAGFDNLGLSGELYNNVSLIPYQNNILLNIVTCWLVFFGGIGFLVIREVLDKRFNWKKLSMHAKVVISMSFALILFGAILLKLTEKVSWLGAFSLSILSRTAGFLTYPLSSFTNAGLLLLMLLMFVGASPGSTGGGIKTSTFFVILQGIKSAATNKHEKSFCYAIPRDTFKKAALIALLGLGIVITGTYLMMIMEPDISLRDAIFEITSAFGTVGFSTGITSSLSSGSKLLTMFIMYIGRLGPLTIATLWHFSRGDRVEYPEGNLAIG